MIIRLGKRELEISRSRLRNLGLAITGDFEVMEDSVRVLAVPVEGTALAVESAATFALTKNVLLVSLEGAEGVTQTLVYPGHSGPLSAKLRKKPGTDEQVVFRVALLAVGTK